ncbi:MAG: DNA polymerase III subunit delta' [Deltaproteobacteria bacterium]|nr:DNA polymerase III subunit delta' [Deltaproteobacteria bacterium]
MKNSDNKKLQTDKIIDQEYVVEILNRLIFNNTVPHALLFSGIKGVGKWIGAKLFAMACNCFNNISIINGDRLCECKSCKKIRNGMNPDIIKISAPDTTIKTDTIRGLLDILALKPFEAKLRFVLIYEAEKMTKEAGNALLKILEEPPEHTCFILTAVNISDLLPTIISRCRHIRFAPLKDKSLACFLTDKYGIADSEAEIIGKMAEGSLENAEMLKDQERFDCRGRLIAELEKITLKPIFTSLLLAEFLSSDKKILEDSLKIIKSWIRDIMIFQLMPDKIINSDFKSGIKTAAAMYNKKNLYSYIVMIETIEKKLSSGINFRLAIENLFLKIGTCR